MVEPTLTLKLQFWRGIGCTTQGIKWTQGPVNWLNGRCLQVLSLEIAYWTLAFNPILIDTQLYFKTCKELGSQWQAHLDWFKVLPCSSWDQLSWSMTATVRLAIKSALNCLYKLIATRNIRNSQEVPWKEPEKRTLSCFSSWKVLGIANSEGRKGIFRWSTEQQRLFAALRPPSVCISGWPPQCPDRSREKSGGKLGFIYWVHN